jgi:hypothetical protein
LSLFSNTQTATGLQTITINLPNTDVYSIVGTIQAPNLVSTPTPGAGAGAGTGTNASPASTASQIVVTIKQNGSTVYTSSAGQRGFALPALSATAGDVITIIPSSSLAQDEQLQAIQITVATSEGQV